MKFGTLTYDSARPSFVSFSVFRNRSHAFEFAIKEFISSNKELDL